ncbi:8836_t:CDS:1 [Racocetra persica]|uniref:8836_t:CDS:1 n=1 Tax=Racocetra persica TaxID=160502 RepID=A0ACA9NQ00_9GLOM|nr:8836_t:CDS:1 [Racocetra persica]
MNLVVDSSNSVLRTHCERYHEDLLRKYLSMNQQKIVPRSKHPIVLEKALPTIRKELFYEKDKRVYCNICDTSYVDYTSPAALRNHYNMNNKQELYYFEINNLNNEFDIKPVDNDTMSITSNISINSVSSDVTLTNNSVKNIIDEFVNQKNIVVCL